MREKLKPFVLLCIFLIVQANAFEDTISLIGRIKRNYTVYEEYLWTRQFQNTTMDQIYLDHSVYIEEINNIRNVQSFYPTVNDSKIFNEYGVPVIDDVIQSNGRINDLWKKFTNLPSFSNVNMSDMLTDDAIPVLRRSIVNVWNDSYTPIYFDFLKERAENCTPMDQHEIATFKLTENYFIDTMLIQLRAYVMLQLSYLTKASKDFVRYHRIARDQRVVFNSKYASFTEETESLVWNLSRVIWSCDNFKSPESNTKLTNFIQGYVDNEINLNPDGSCAEYCHDYKLTKNYDCKRKSICGANYYDQNKTRCNGKVRDCDYFRSTFTYCPNENDQVTDRRIEFVKMASGRALGNEKFCQEPFAATPFMSWLATCRYCFCYCDETGPHSDRHFSLRNVTSNIDENFVISGVRIVKKNGIIHLTAIEQQLLPNAHLNTSSAHLISNHSFSIGDVGVRPKIDFHEMTYANRTINLDTITAKRNELVTGVRFRVHSGSLHLEARFTYFDEDTGKLDLSTPSEWKMNSNTNRFIIPTNHLGVPTESDVQSVAIGDVDKESIVFGPTSWAHDMAQNTVPFIDSIQVETFENVPLSGVGIFYKSQNGFGGYLAPKLVTYDYGATAMRIRSATGVYGVFFFFFFRKLSKEL